MILPWLCSVPFAGDPNRATESYSIKLVADYTREQHAAELTFNLAKYIQSTLPNEGNLLYLAELNDDHLAAVRAEGGLQVVECA